METTLFIPTETDIKKWVKEALFEHFSKGVPQTAKNDNGEPELLNRKQVAKMLQVSLVTLTDWIKRGLPSHKQRGRVYFLKNEVLDYIKLGKLRLNKASETLQGLQRKIA